MSEEKEYIVSWVMPLTATSPEDATCQALAIHRDPQSIATVFTVESAASTLIIDVEDPSNPVRLKAWPAPKLEIAALNQKER